MAESRRNPYDGRSLREEVAYVRLVAELARMQAWWERDRRRPGVIPADAAAIAGACRGPRSKLTLELDAEVVKWFRAMGHGYQARSGARRTCCVISKVILSRGRPGLEGRRDLGAAEDRRRDGRLDVAGRGYPCCTPVIESGAD